MKLISFGKIEKTLFYPILYCFSLTVRMKLLANDNNPFLNNFLSCFALLFLGIFFLFEPCYQNKTNEIKHTYVTYIIIIIIAVTNSIFCLGIFFLEKQFDGNLANEIRFISIYFVFYFTHKIFKIQRAKHFQFVYLVMFVCQICLSIIIIPLTVIGETFQNDFVNSKLLYSIMVICSLLCDVYFSTKHITEKYLMDIHFVSPMKLFFLEGIIGFIVNVIASAIMTIPKCPENKNDQIGKFRCIAGESVFQFDEMIKYFNDNSFECILFLICSIGVEFGMTMTNKIYLPTYRPIFDSIVTFLVFLITFIGGGKLTSYIEIIKVVFYIIIVFACLVANQLIILHCCDLDRDIKKNVLDRDKNEFEEMRCELNKLEPFRSFIDDGGQIMANSQIILNTNNDQGDELSTI